MRVLLFAVVLFFTLPLAPTPPTVASDNTDEFPHVVSWRAPADHTGPLALRFTIDYGFENSCHRMYEWTTKKSDETDLNFMKTSETNTNIVAYYSEYAVIRHGGVDTTTITQNNEGYEQGVRLTETYPVPPIEHVSLAITSGFSWTDPEGRWGPLAFEISCAEPVSIHDLSGSTQLVGFTLQDFEGTTVAVNGAIAGVTANVNGTLEGTFDTEQAAFTGLHRGTTIDGQVRVEGDEEITYDLSDIDDWHVFGHEGTGDTWRVGLDRIGGGIVEGLYGYVAGYDSVSDFDELF